jgi:hypothetical protein
MELFKLSTIFPCPSLLLFSFSLHLYLRMCLSVCLTLLSPACLHVCLSVYLSVCLSFCLSVFLSFCLSVFLPFCLSVFLFFCLSVFLSHYLRVQIWNIKFHCSLLKSSSTTDKEVPLFAGLNYNGIFKWFIVFCKEMNALAF